MASLMPQTWTCGGLAPASSTHTQTLALPSEKGGNRENQNQETVRWK